jgi:hypothetical protein
LELAEPRKPVWRTHPRHQKRQRCQCQRLSASPAGQQFATVSLHDGTQIGIESGGVQYPAVLATHVPGVALGQRVLVAFDGAACLIIAAWPQANQAPLLQYDAVQGRLQINAAQLDIQALSTLELVCGPTRISLDVSGRLEIHGNDILSSAMGAQRIEGGSIDFN